MKKFALSVVAFGLLSSVAFAQTPPPTPAAKPADTPKPKMATVTFGADLTSAYMFRGIFQEDSGAIVQPHADVALAVNKKFSLDFGNWESQHSAGTGTFYESDYFASGTYTAGKVKPGFLFTSYTSPNDRFKTVNELAAVVGFDDSASKLPFSPTVVLAFELKGQADGGEKKGTYLELGGKPVIKLQKKESPITLAIPLKVGLGLKDYYEGVTGTNKFGYFDLGFIGSVPIKVSKGSFEIHGGVDFLTFGDNMKLLNHDDRVKPVASLGFSYAY